MLLYYDLFCAERRKTMADNRPIGVFDSGLGGLTVLKELKKLLPNERFVYFGDTSRVPYGSKSDETIKMYAMQDERFLLSKDVKYIVAACGTVSAVAADTADVLPVCFMGVVENAVRNAVAATKNRKIGVIGTQATINNGAHKRLIKKLMPDAEVVTAGCPLFVPLVEEGWFSADDSAVNLIAHRYLDSIIESKADTIILGCTHYPILSEAIQKVVGESVTLINMGVSTAEAVKRELSSKNMLCDNKEGKIELYVSDKTAAFEKVAGILLGDKIEGLDVSLVDISKYE